MNVVEASQPPLAAHPVNAGCNPFIGARPFLAPPLPTQLFGNRRAEVAALHTLIHAHSAVILHGGAGVGKSSLLHAALLPELAAAGCQVRELPAHWLDEQRAAWFAHTRRTLPAAECLLVVDPADGFVHDGAGLQECCDLLATAPRLHLLFCLRSAPAARLEATLRNAGIDCAAFALAGLEPEPLAAMLASVLGGPDAAGAAMQLLAALHAPARDQRVEPALLQIAGRLLWPQFDDAPTALTRRIDDALAAHYAGAIDAALARRPGLATVRDLEAWLTRQLGLAANAPTLVLRGADASAGLPNALIDALEDGWLLRTYPRGGSDWVGLLDPRLATPVQQALAHLAAAMPLAGAATNWANSGRDPRFLLDAARTPAGVAAVTATPARYGTLEHELLSASIAALADTQRAHGDQPAAPPADRFPRRMAILATALVCVLLVLALWALTTAHSAQRALAELQTQLAAQQTALAARGAEVEQMRRELAAAAAEAAIAAAQSARNEQLGRALQAGQLAGAALLRREDAPTQALLYAVEALRVQEQASEPPVPEALQGLRDLLTTLGGLPYAVAGDDIAALALSADGALLAAGDMAGELYLWRTTDGARVHVPAAHAGPIWGLAWLPDQRLVSSGADGIVQLWTTADAAGAPALTPTDPVALSATDLYALDMAATGDRLVSGDAAGAVRLWQPDNPAAVQTTAQHASAVNVVRLAPDGSAGASGSLDGQVLYWQPAQQAAATVARHAGAVNALAFSPDGRWLVSAGADGRLLLYDRTTGAVTTLPPHASAVNTVGFSVDSQWLASGDDNGLVRLWSMADPSAPLPLRGHRNSVRSLNFVTTAAGPRLLTISYDRTARLWDYLQPEASPVVLRGHDGQLTHLAVAGNRVATAAYDHTVRLWNVDDPFAQPAQIIATRRPQGELALAPDGSYLVAASLTRPYAEVWDPASGLPLYQREGHNGALAALAVSPDGRQIFTGGRDGRVRIWQTAGAQPGPPGPTLAGHVGPVNSLAVAPNGLFLASGGDDTTVRLWEIATGRHITTQTGHGAAVMGVAFSPDGATLASVDRTGVLLLHDAVTGALQHSLASDGAGLLAVAFRPDGRWVAAAAEDGAIWIWDLAALALGPTTLRRHAAEVNALAFSPAGDQLASVDADGLLYLWDLTRLSAPPVAVRAHPASVNAVAFTADGAGLYTAGADGAIRRWTVAQAALIDAACTTAGRNLTTAEWGQVFDTAPYRATCPQMGE